MGLDLELVKVVSICTAIWLFAILVLANAVYAFLRPGKWLAAKWTFTRGLRGLNSPEDLAGVQGFAGLLLFGGLVLLYAAIETTAKAWPILW